MNLNRRAVGGIAVAGSLVVMSAVAGAAETVAAEPTAVAVETRTDLATNGTAGVVVWLNEVETEAMGAIDRITAGMEHTEIALVAAAEEEQEIPAEQETPAERGQEILAEQEMSAEEEQEIPAEQEMPVEQEVPAEQAQETLAEQEMPAEQEVPAEQEAPAASEEELLWQNRLMAEVEEFLYVRAAGDENAQIVGKMYKGDVAEIVEVGDTWSHVVSGNVDGWVMNSYCVSGTDAMNYAMETVETSAEIQADGLRIRSEADTEGSVIGVVSTGMELTVDTDAELVDGWVAVNYGGQTSYVSAEYVTTELALGEAITITEEQEALAKQKEAEEAKKAAQVASSGTVQSTAVAASVDDVTLLAALIQCEAGNESYEGQLAVGAVVMNRVKSGSYPGDIYSVIYQSGQFPPAGKGSVANIAANGPKGSCIQAAQEAINGMDNTGGAVRFKRASSGQAGVVIGNHVFY